MHVFVVLHSSVMTHDDWALLALNDDQLKQLHLDCYESIVLMVEKKLVDHSALVADDLDLVPVEHGRLNYLLLLKCLVYRSLL